MSLRPEHLEPIIRRGQQNEAMLRLFVMDELVTNIEAQLVDPKAIEKALEIYESIQADEGKYVYADFKAAMIKATSEAKMPALVKRRIDLYLRFLFPE